MGIEIKFPALVIGKKSIDRINYRHFAGNKNFINIGYMDVVIVDSVGNFFYVIGTRQIGGVSLIDSILNFSWLVKMEPILKEPVKTIELDKLKNITIDVVENNHKFFADLDDTKSIIKKIKKSNSHLELINVF